VLKNNNWRSNKHNQKKKKRINAGHEENVRVKAHAYCLCSVHRWVDRF